MLRRSRKVPLAWCNLVHDPWRLLLAVAGIAFAVLLMFMQFGFQGALFDNMLRLPKQLNAEIVLVSPMRTMMVMKQTFPRHRLVQSLGVDGVKSAWPLYFENRTSVWRSEGSDLSRVIRVLAYDPRQPVLNAPELLSQADKLLARRNVLFDRRSKPEVYGQVTEGTDAELGGQQVHVAGLFSMGTDFADDGNVVCSSETFRDLFLPFGSGDDRLGDVDVGLLQVAPGASAFAVRQRLRQTLPKDVLVLTKDEFVAREKAFWNNATPIGYVFNVGVGIGLVVGIAICYQILYSDIADHLHEFATLKAMGYPRGYFIKIVLQEAALLSLLGFFPGWLISWMLYGVVAQQTGLVFTLPAGRIVLVLVLTILMCVVAGTMTVRKVLSADPAELF